MINDKKLGIKIAGNAEEAAWEKIRQQVEETIEHGKRDLIINQTVLELAKRKLKEFPSGGSKSTK